jgi:hypothetical protein
MPIQKYHVVIQVKETLCYEKSFEIDSNDYYEPGEDFPVDMLSNNQDLLEEVFLEDFEYSSDIWEFIEFAVFSSDGVCVESIKLI